MTRRLDLAAILHGNSQIQKERVDAYLAYQQSLRDRGLDVKPTYGVVAALGRTSSLNQSLVTSSPPTGSRRG